VIEATALATPWQVGIRAGSNQGTADPVEDGAGGTAGMRPHQPLEAALATCMTISARTALADLDQPSTGVVVRLHQDRGESATRVRYEVVLDPPLERHRAAIMARVERSPVRTTLTRDLIFEPAAAPEQGPSQAGG
jgi:putative redox protein